MGTTWLDRAIGWIDPEAGLRRIAARVAADQFREATRAYDAARRGRRNDGWTATGTSANSEIGPSLQTIRANSRALVRNNPYAARAAMALAGNIVGAGITPRPMTADKARKQQARDDWRRFSDACDPQGLADFEAKQHQAARAIVESGAALLRWYVRPSSFGLAVPLQVDVLEPDYIDLGKNQALPDGGMILQGVEFDQWGRRVAYWLFDQHPGEPVIQRRYTSQRVPAAFIDHVFDILRPGQIHGVPWFAPVTVKARDLGDYDESELFRKKVAACFAVFVKHGGGPAQSSLGKVAPDPKGRPVEQLAPGMIRRLGPGEDITFAAPEDSGDYVDYMRVNLHAIAAGVGTTYEQMTGDLSNVNYSSMRGGRNEFNVLLDHWQWHMMVPQSCRPAWGRVSRLCTALGRWATEVPGEWQPPARAYVNPREDVAARKEEIRNGLKTWYQGVAEQGWDPDEQIDQIAEFLAAVDAKGIVLDCDPRRITSSGAAQSSGNNEGNSDGRPVN